MTRETRNNLFIENMGMIDQVIATNKVYLKTLRFDIDDVKQDLSLCLLEVIDEYKLDANHDFGEYLSNRLASHLRLISKQQKKAQKINFVNLNDLRNENYIEESECLYA